MPKAAPLRACRRPLRNRKGEFYQGREQKTRFLPKTVRKFKSLHPAGINPGSWNDEH